MSTDAQDAPSHIQELVVASKTSNTMLIDCWGKLSVAEQIEVIRAIEMYPDGAKFYGDMYLEQLMACVMQNSCLYVKHAFISKAKANCFLYNNEKMNKLIKQDSSPVINCLVDCDDFTISHCSFSDVAIVSFYSLSHENRLAIVRGTIFGSPIAKLLAYALEDGKTCASVQELCDIASEYLLNERFRNYCSDEWLATNEDYPPFFSDGLKMLWELIPRVPLQLATVLMRYLPAYYGFSYLSHELDFMTIDEKLAKIYLYRDDVYDTATRHHVFFNASSVGLRFAASSRCLELDFDEFTKILSFPENVRNEMLECLLAGDAQRLAIANAIFDLLCAVSTRTREVEQARILFNRRFENKQSAYYDDEINQLRIYRMAHLVAINKSSCDNSDIEPLLRDITVYGDAWATFLNYTNLKLFRPNFNFIHVCPEATKLEWGSCYRFARELLPAEFLDASPKALETSNSTEAALESAEPGGFLSAIKKIIS